MLARIALQILTNYWGIAGDYRDRIIEFMTGVPWDLENDAREVAISAAGDLVRHERDSGLLEQLLKIAEDKSESSSIRAEAIKSLGRAQGMSWQDLPNPAEAMPLDGPLASAILARAHAMTMGSDPDRP